MFKRISTERYCKWQNSSFYRESGYQRLGLRHELAALVPDVTQTSLAAVSVLRSRDFSARDREVLNRLRLHLGRAWRLPPFGSHQPSPARLRRLFASLSARESEVLFWMTEGKQNREISEILGRSLNTVQEHVENINRKLGMENRGATVVLALRAMLERQVITGRSFMIMGRNGRGRWQRRAWRIFRLIRRPFSRSEKGDWRKGLVAAMIHAETTMKRDWISEQLHMGTRAGVCCLAADARQRRRKDRRLRGTWEAILELSEING